MTQEQLAERANVAETFIQNLESRRTQLAVPGEWPDFRSVCVVLGLDPRDVLRSVGVV